ncbi:TIGR04086 family membrane protein [Oceanobacillus caeni]|uniref:TIGR04086 family membrane protein n=1 Tax=Oceanobacillus TaxID=182709 RepID=UPI000622841C|nr:TIGR04086 family membrane protein [Oceanobacillus caeni]KKE80540.1 membrane protein [Bacilli bacterium VT-13-104]PZD87773.1 TIGR04086 family membrane protein [Bacilli bacterium]MBU8789529.1 TIGR04086 family membrane protein [Oceanobacillus caeni]MCR1833940.1 TIGR04086 family membrane protein [Oceanobacillus caeni]PZD89050.1 TIGR04086 family membrane protein [Bacilli bacterium]
MRKQLFHALLFGWITVLGLILISSVIIAFLLKVTSLDENLLSWIALVIGILSLFIGGLITGLKGKAKGWIVGAITGIGFTVFTFLVQYLGYQQGFSMEQSLHHIGFIFAAVIGGVIGVNIIGDTSE